MGCAFAEDEDGCDKEKHRCFWGWGDAGSRACQEKCSGLQTDGACNRLDHCMWSEDACKPGCFSYGQDSCPIDQCMWDAGQCKPACWSMTDAESCKNVSMENGCIWQGGQCITDPGAVRSSIETLPSSSERVSRTEASATTPISSTTPSITTVSTTTPTSSRAVHIELVVSVSCSDDLAWVDEVDCEHTSVYLYSRGSPGSGSEQVSCRVPQLPHCARMEILPDATEVVAAYLHHLKARRARLAEPGTPPGALVFLPGDAKWADGLLGAAEYARGWAAAGVGFAPLSFAACSREGLQAQGSEASMGLVCNLFSFLTGVEGSRNWVAGLENQFFVSFRREGEVPTWLYDHLLDVMSDADGGQWRAPAMERLWGPLFGCWAPFPHSLGLLRGAYPECKDDCDGGPSCGPNRPLVQRGAAPRQGTREWVQSMLAPADHALSACTGRARLFSEGYAAHEEVSGWPCELLFQEGGPSAGPGVCAVGFLVELTEIGSVGPPNTSRDVGGGHHQPSRRRAEGAGLDADLTPHFWHIGLGKACSNGHDIRLGSSSTEGSIQKCGKACLMYSECAGFSWEEARRNCTLLTGTCERGGDELVQLYAKRTALAPLEVVLAGYCRDDFDWIRKVDCAAAVVFLYTKCDSEDPLQNIPARLPPCFQLEVLSNVGREGGTFFYHLHLHRERFASSPNASGALVFLQGEVEWRRGPLDVLEFASQWASAGFGFVPLAWAGPGDRGPFLNQECGRSCWVSRTRQLQNLFEFFSRQSEAQSWIAGFRGQMLVSKRRASRVPAWVLKYSLELLASEETSRSWYGMAFERLWNVVFGCWAPNLKTTQPLALTDFPACLDDCDANGSGGDPGPANASECGPDRPVAWEGLPAPMGQQEWIGAMLRRRTAAPMRSAPRPGALASLRSEGHTKAGLLPWHCDPLIPGLDIPKGHGVCAFRR
ncbi:unnamed protein product [Prorocentrum cordatum]|uniref:Apple domain-containing protein n=1 Tax=Prorocentrum cordatum TaxID=2364126 RepID=A0ABN9XFF3_9DINO|nr:unnamed protein product [Polarella glacialis]